MNRKLLGLVKVAADGKNKGGESFPTLSASLRSMDDTIGMARKGVDSAARKATSMASQGKSAVAKGVKQGAYSLRNAVYGKPEATVARKAARSSKRTFAPAPAKKAGSGTDYFGGLGLNSLSKSNQDVSKSLAKSQDEVDSALKDLDNVHKAPVRSKPTGPVLPKDKSTARKFDPTPKYIGSQRAAIGMAGEAPRKSLPIPSKARNREIFQGLKDRFVPKIKRKSFVPASSKASEGRIGDLLSGKLSQSDKNSAAKRGRNLIADREAAAEKKNFDRSIGKITDPRKSLSRERELAKMRASRAKHEGWNKPKD